MTISIRYGIMMKKDPYCAKILKPVTNLLFLEGN
jgi:hypothetical protein